MTVGIEVYSQVTSALIRILRLEQCRDHVLVLYVGSIQLSSVKPALDTGSVLMITYPRSPRLPIFQKT